MYTREEYLSVSHFALERLERSSSSLDQTLYQSIQTVVDGMEGGVVLHSILPPDPIVVLDSVVQDLQKSADERSGVLHKSSRGLTSFLLSILRELREIICGKGKKPKPLGKEAHAAVSALAALLLRVDGIADTARKKIKSTTGVSQMLARRVAGEQEEAASQDSQATRLPVESRPDHSW